MSADPTPRSRRDRVRESTIREIKATALELMRSSGSIDIRFADIARAMGMTPPGLYRYFADREALLTALISDAYADLADRLHAAADQAGSLTSSQRFAAVCAAYRDWARQRPERLDLTFGAPLAGYATPEGAGTTASAHRAMSALRDTLTGADDSAGPSGAVDERTERGLLQAWAALHGVVTLEVFGHLSWMSKAARDELFDAQVRLAYRAAREPGTGPREGPGSPVHRPNRS